MTASANSVLMVIRILLVLCLMSQSQAVRQVHQLGHNSHLLETTLNHLQNVGDCVASVKTKGITVVHAQTGMPNYMTFLSPLPITLFYNP